MERLSVVASTPPERGCGLIARASNRPGTRWLAIMPAAERRTTRAYATVSAAPNSIFGAKEDQKIYAATTTLAHAPGTLEKSVVREPHTAARALRGVSSIRERVGAI